MVVPGVMNSMIVLFEDGLQDESFGESLGLASSAFWHRLAPLASPEHSAILLGTPVTVLVPLWILEEFKILSIDCSASDKLCLGIQVKMHYSILRNRRLLPISGDFNPVFWKMRCNPKKSLRVPLPNMPHNCVLHYKAS